MRPFYGSEREDRGAHPSPAGRPESRSRRAPGAAGIAVLVHGVSRAGGQLAGASLESQSRVPRPGLHPQGPNTRRRRGMRLSPRRALLAAGCALALAAVAQLALQVRRCRAALAGPRWAMRPEREELALVGADRVEHRYGHGAPLVFVGGVPRSGTTLMRAMLDAHPEVRCGQETRIIPRVLALRQAWARPGAAGEEEEEGGPVPAAVLDAATQAFILQVVARHGEPARVLCNKDPFTLRSAVYLAGLFPGAKFLLMLRDGRASVHSMITRRVTVAGFDLGSYRDCLARWSQAVQAMHAQCAALGRARCLPVRYEQLVLHPRRSLERVLAFLGLAWSDAVLHHEDLVGRPGGVALSKVEPSTEQVIKPVNLQALSRWAGHLPADVVRDMARIAPMLARLGYDPYANPPDYGHPDPEVVDNTRRVLRGDYKTPASLKGYLPVTRNDTRSAPPPRVGGS
nr:protein-tyrosine sulfotransferase 2-like [Microcebus murinus]